MKILGLLSAALLVAGCGEKSSEKSSDSVTHPLRNADVRRLLKEAVDVDSLQKRNDLAYRVNESEPYSGWVKEMYDSGQVRDLSQRKDGKYDGLVAAWHENGQRRVEATFKDGKYDGFWTYWHENGHKMGESTYRDGELISAKFWNNKGEEVETQLEAIK